MSIVKIGFFIAWMLWLFQGWFIVSPRAAAQNETVLPLPDLQTLPPYDLQLINPSGGTRLLRFSNSVANTGAGPLELIGERDPETHSVTLIQQVHGSDGRQITRRLGGFDYHAEHYHWHWEGFSIYEIWTLGLIAELDEAVIHSGKVGYCMLDSSRADPLWLEAQDLEDYKPAPRQTYWGCGWQRQGISAGWVDTYLRHLTGQTMDVTALEDGVYALRSTVDPDGLLAELDTTNNAALTYFRLEGNRLTVLKDVRYARDILFHSLYGENLPEETPRIPKNNFYQSMQ